MDTETFTRPLGPKSGESHFGGISIRGWLAILISMTGCSLYLMGASVDPQFLMLWMTVLSFYFGQQKTGQTTPTKPDSAT